MFESCSIHFDKRAKIPFEPCQEHSFVRKKTAAKPALRPLRLLSFLLFFQIMMADLIDLLIDKRQVSLSCYLLRFLF